MDIRMDFSNISSPSCTPDPQAPVPLEPQEDLESVCPEYTAAFRLSGVQAYVEGLHPELAETLDYGDWDFLVKLGIASLHLP